MKATVDAKEFSQALGKVIKAVKPSKIPELGGVLVQIKDERCTLTGTDFTTWLSVTIPAAGDDLGFVFQRPKDAAKACGHFEGQLTLETEEKDTGKERWTQLTMFCGARSAEIRAFLQEDYPVIPEHQTRHTYTVNAARLLERVNHVKYTLKKPSLNGQDFSMRPKQPIFHNTVESAASFWFTGIVPGVVPLRSKFLAYQFENEF